MRITKKFAGASCIGKQVFTPSDVIPESQKGELNELESLRINFMRRIYDRSASSTFGHSFSSANLNQSQSPRDGETSTSTSSTRRQRSDTGEMSSDRERSNDQNDESINLHETQQLAARDKVDRHSQRSDHSLLSHTRSNGRIALGPKLTKSSGLNANTSVKRALSAPDFSEWQKITENRRIKARTGNIRPGKGEYLRVPGIARRQRSQSLVDFESYFTDDILAGNGFIQVKLCCS